MSYFLSLEMARPKSLLTKEINKGVGMDKESHEPFYVECSTNWYRNVNDGLAINMA